jgi:replicative DNA helicase
MVSIEDLKLPPHNLDAERGVLSGILIDNAVMDICDNVSLEIKDFYAKEHQMIFDAMMSLKNSYKTIDIVTVADELAKKDFLDII